MNTVQTIITALGGTAGIGALVAAVVSYLKAKTAAIARKEASSADHAEQDRKLDEILALVGNYRAENEQLKAQIARLESRNDKLTIALGSQTGHKV